MFRRCICFWMLERIPPVGRLTMVSLLKSERSSRATRALRRFSMIGHLTTVMTRSRRATALQSRIQMYLLLTRKLFPIQQQACLLHTDSRSAISHERSYRRSSLVSFVSRNAQRTDLRAHVHIRIDGNNMFLVRRLFISGKHQYTCQSCNKNRIMNNVLERSETLKNGALIFASVLCLSAHRSFSP